VPALGKILLYLVLVVLAGAALAPPIYWLLHSALDFPFYRYLSRVTQIVAFILLGPLLYWLGIRKTKEFGLERNPRAARDFFAGLALAVIPGIALGAAYLSLEVYRMRDEVALLAMARIAATAAVVAGIEEFLFRGVLLGLAAKAFGSLPAAIGISAIFAEVHFLRPLRTADRGVEWWAGFALVVRIFEAGPPPSLWIAGFLVLFVAGMLLAYARLKTRSLWLPIGLHAGWIASQQTLQWLGKYQVEPAEALLPWVGPNLVSGAVPTGLAPLGMLLLTAGGVWFYLRHAPAAASGS
jgi:uncharacterized protein